MKSYPLPAVLRSRQHLITIGTLTAADVLSIKQEGTTYTMAQEVCWIDASHFAVGRWDGSLSIFNFQNSPSQGPLMTDVVNSPTQEGVQMITYLAPKMFVTSNDDQSLIIWKSPSGDWRDVSVLQQLSYPSTLGVANSGAAFPSLGGTAQYLVVGHDSGILSIWSSIGEGLNLTLLTTVNLCSAHPVNPWNLHNIRGVSLVSQDPTYSYVVTGSEDGNLTIVRLPDGKIMNAVVYNPTAQRGINNVASSAQGLLVSNCAVGPTDKNLWYYSIDIQTWEITYHDSVNLAVNASAAQVFNFDVIWGVSSSVPCWFSSTEEGYLWSGSISGNSIEITAKQQVTSQLGAALAITPAGSLAFVAYDVYQFSMM